MQNESIVSHTVDSWSPFVSNKQNNGIEAICLFGPHNAGKSTLCMLFERYIENKLNPNLIFQDTKHKLYSYLGVITSNPTKSVHDVPQLYQFESKVQNVPDSIMIDVPAAAIPPTTEADKKEWNALDSRMSLSYLFSTIKSASIALVLTQKWLRMPMENTKALLNNFFTMFGNSKQLINNTCIIVSKCPIGYTMQQCLSQFQLCLSKDQTQDQTLNHWFGNLRKRNAIFLFYKFSTQDQVRRQQVRRLYTELIRLQKYQISKQNKLVLNKLSKEEDNQIKSYVNGVEKGFIQAIKLVKAIAEGNIKDREQFLAAKDKLALQINGVDKSTQKQGDIPQLPKVNQLHTLLTKLTALKNEGANVLQDILQLFVDAQVISCNQCLGKSLDKRALLFKTFYVQGQDTNKWNVHTIVENIQKQAKSALASQKLQGA